ncbi:double-strand break repair helicase AddA [Hyphomicrobium methylovorum]|uniref:double-strand break repair helicase AddA n=1 Tax=Hyphomicrobium methylovorum TaxID=84 RepID=UPI0015E73BE3|nr:double-strand break repair helicase AddA [Hyphomicrobium methylovorum]MBA2125556.1 double-strand break repair helicase AddA [Hyphomicrobium methylovorum]
MTIKADVALETKRVPIETLVAETTQRQLLAADPAGSAWVKANAGTGKTHVLTLRVLRLLLAGTKPERILCLTYTKAAAAEMSRRVFDVLAEWVTASDEKLTEDLTKTTGSRPTAETLKLARRLFASAIETPGGLKIQTIHAFSERLLQRFPLEAGVPPDFKVLDDAAAKELKADAVSQTLLDATSAPQSALGRALDVIIRYATDIQFDALINTAVEERRWLDVASGREYEDDDFAAIDAYLRESLGARLAITSDNICAECADVLSPAELREIADHLATGLATDTKNSLLLKTALAASDPLRRLEALRGYFIKKDGDPQSKVMTKALAASRPDLNSRCQDAQEKFFALLQEMKAVALVEASMALHTISRVVLKRYTKARADSGALDFADLILKTRALLGGKDGEAQWVLFKLDGGLDHILVDEAQDTSPEQWQIISALAEEFFADSARASETPRTVFAVGDEKQSIYSFQGADPKRFAEAGTRFARLAEGANLAWRPVALTMSFRTVAPVLAGVDSVFADTTRTPGLTMGDRVPVHSAIRLGEAGLIELWPTEKKDDKTFADPWSPLSDASERSPENRLAERIAGTIKSWIDTKEVLIAAGREIRYGDILILVRKRAPFVAPMVAALKRLQIPVSSSDQRALTDQIAVQDLIVLGDFLTLPEDDLALATVLKSPIFGLDDDDLLAIAPKRKGTLWKAFIEAAETNVHYKEIYETLKGWRRKADFIPPFEFYSEILDRDGVRFKMLHRLGPEAADAIDDFLDVALKFDDRTPPSLTRFLAELRETNPAIKRDMNQGRDEVRVMTVHGAKGLEAPIVFLPDTCSTRSGDQGARLMKLAQDGEPSADRTEPIVWSIKGTSKLAAIQRAQQTRDELERDERNRLLYVAMTRARDRLYVSGFQSGNLRDDCWYSLIERGLEPLLTDVDLGNGRTVRRYESQQTAKPKEKAKEAAAEDVIVGLPDFASRAAPVEPKLSIPLAPSRLEPYAPDAEGEPITQPRRTATDSRDAPSPLAANSEIRFLRGTLTHALLQHLPDVAETERERVAAAYVARRGESLSSSVRAGIVKETLAILSAPQFAALFGADSMAEVPIAAVIPRPPGKKGPALDLSGQIDRLAVTDREVLIVDYKTNRPPPADVGSVADAYLFQLAAYRMALSRIYPGKTVRAALLWTDGPRIMDVPADVLNACESRLWDLDVESLDAS